MNREREIREAIQAAEDTLSCLDEAAKHLSSASGWGLADMFGGGFFTTMMKRSRMNDARGAVQDAQRAMARLVREMQDVEEMIHVDLDLDGFLGLADYFFDGFAADFLVQSQIGRAREQVDEARNQIERIIGRLYAML